MHHFGRGWRGSANDLSFIGVSRQPRLLDNGLIDRSRSEDNRRFDRRFPVRRDHCRQLEAAVDKLIGGRRGQTDELHVPPFQLRQATARSDFWNLSGSYTINGWKLIDPRLP